MYNFGFRYYLILQWLKGNGILGSTAKLPKPRQ